MLLATQISSGRSSWQCFAGGLCSPACCHPPGQQGCTHSVLCGGYAHHRMRVAVPAHCGASAVSQQPGRGILLCARSSMQQQGISTLSRCCPQSELEELGAAVARQQQAAAHKEAAAQQQLLAAVQLVEQMQADCQSAIDQEHRQHKAELQQQQAHHEVRGISLGLRVLRS
jgi:hypothetical protein